MMFAVGILTLAPAAQGSPNPSALLLHAPYHGAQVATLVRANTTCGHEGLTNRTQFSYLSGSGGSATVRAVAASCAGSPGGGTNVAVYADTVNIRFHGLGGSRTVYANLSLNGSGGVTLSPGSCSRGNSSNWSCSDIAQSALDLYVVLLDLTAGTAYLPTTFVGGQLGTEIVNTTSCTASGRCSYSTGYNVCTIPLGCVWVSRHAFSPTWSGSMAGNSTISVPAMNASHVYELQLQLSDYAWVGCATSLGTQTGCRATAWQAAGPGGTGLRVASITTR